MHAGPLRSASRARSCGGWPPWSPSVSSWAYAMVRTLHAGTASALYSLVPDFSSLASTQSSVCIVRRAAHRGIPGRCPMHVNSAERPAACAALVGYVEYPVVGLASGFASLSDLQADIAGSSGNGTEAYFGACVVPGTGPSGTIYAGLLVPCRMHASWHACSRELTALQACHTGQGAALAGPAGSHMLSHMLSAVLCAAVRRDQWRRVKGDLAGPLLVPHLPHRDGRHGRHALGSPMHTCAEGCCTGATLARTQQARQ